MHTSPRRRPASDVDEVSLESPEGQGQSAQSTPTKDCRHRSVAPLSRVVPAAVLLLLFLRISSREPERVFATAVPITSYTCTVSQYRQAEQPDVACVSSSNLYMNAGCGPACTWWRFLAIADYWPIRREPCVTDHHGQDFAQQLDLRFGAFVEHAALVQAKTKE